MAERNMKKLLKRLKKKNELKVKKSSIAKSETRKKLVKTVSNINMEDCSTNDQTVSMDINETEEEQKIPKSVSSIAQPNVSTISNSCLSDTAFASLADKISINTMKAIDEMGFSTMTEIQAKAIPHLLEGKDLMASARTGSGKTLGFLIPVIELLLKLKFTPRNGCGCIVLSPTRELSMQTYGVLREVMTHHNQTIGLVMGGANRHQEATKLTNGVNILVATPGRLLDHMQNTNNFVYKNLVCLVIDEADRILQVGFEEELRKIISLLPKKRQTMLFSATQTKKTEDLARISLRENPLYIGVDDSKEIATVEGLEQGYVVVPSDRRFLLLFTFLKKNRTKKIMVFFSSCLSVKYHYELLNYIDLQRLREAEKSTNIRLVTCVSEYCASDCTKSISDGRRPSPEEVMAIHGKNKQAKRTSTFFKFCSADSGTLLCTDVAARGLDIPAVDWIVQFDPPDDPKEYIHRVGRTARGVHGQGRALLFLRPEELTFLRYLRKCKVPLNEYEFAWNKIANVQSQLEKLVAKNYFLHKSATEAYKSYIRAYDSHHLKETFDVNSLDLTAVASSFGFTSPPFVDLSVHAAKMAGRSRGKPLLSNRKQTKKVKMYRQPIAT